MPAFKTGLKKTDLKEGKLLRTEINGKSIVLGMINDKLYAMDSVCSHEGGPLEDGSMDGYNLICPWHQGIFDIRNAKASPETSWVTDMESYAVVINDKDGEISIETNKSKDTIGGKSFAQSEINQEKELLPSRPLKLQLKLIDKIFYIGTDITSFKFTRGENRNYLNYKAGQYGVVDLGTKDDPEGPNRSFTLASSPTEEDYILISTRIRDTPFKHKFKDLPVGSLVEITAPMGNFTLHEQESMPAVFLSGGIGVTPFRSMIKYATDRQLPIRIMMFDSNRNEGNILYKEEFDEWKRLNKNLKIVYTLTPEGEEKEKFDKNGWTGETGYVNGVMIRKYINDDELADAIFYLCGPPGMLNAMKNLLTTEMHIPEDQIKEEEFSGY
jgi:ferredoxin-NADP reductase/nitrite reductase/ring-hydroxylating ferredoxin subunit